ncbi:MAG: Tn3 family transposase, partial [Methylococcales bacterium]
MLIDTLLQTVKNATNLADRHQKEAYFKEREKRNESIDAFKQNIFETLSAIQHIVDDNQLNNNQKVPLISKALEAEKVKLETLTVNQATKFLDEFQHWQPKYQREKPAVKTFFAGIMGYGCDIGHRKLAQIANEINENELACVVRWYFSLQNVQAANDRVLQFISQLDLPQIYQSKSEKLHTSSDGRKREVDGDSLNANHSFKYFGQNKGASTI